MIKLCYPFRPKEPTEPMSQVLIWNNLKDWFSVDMSIRAPKNGEVVQNIWFLESSCLISRTQRTVLS
jgi:hypothetical protein